MLGGTMDLPVLSEVVFEVTREPNGGYDAESDTENLSAQGDTWEDLCANVKRTVERYFQEGPRPQSIRLHHVREEILSLV
jgi:predicted RNase H-like HicB family nuclease